MRGQVILRIVAFVIFFGIGAAALSGSILFEDLRRYCENKKLLRSAQQSLQELASLNDDYDALLKELRQDPNLLQRIAPVALGVRQQDSNTVYPSLTPEQLDAARKALTEGSREAPADSLLNRLLERLNRPWRRTMLSIAGSALILISVVWFGAGKKGIPRAPGPTHDQSR
jgi:hypothetical protein